MYETALVLIHSVMGITGAHPANAMFPPRNSRPYDRGYETHHHSGRYSQGLVLIKLVDFKSIYFLEPAKLGPSLFYIVVMI